MRTNRTMIVVVLALLLVAALALPASAQVSRPGFKALRSVLTGAAEAPGPGDPNGFGHANFRFNQATGQVCYNLTVRNITLPATGAHIHRGGPGIAGGVVVPLTPPNASGRSSGCTTADPALIGEILANPAGFYVNVHTTDYPAGAVRGQLIGRPFRS